MSYAPSDLLAVRSYLMVTTGLPAVSLGIVGDAAHGNGGYHVGWDRLSQGLGVNDYSYRESSRDNVKSDAASALDIGQFNFNGVNLRTFSVALANACRNGDPRASSIREIIYSPDGVNVVRYDRLGIRSGGDSSHLSHTHISFFRNSEGERAGNNSILGLMRSILGVGMELSDAISNTGTLDNTSNRNVDSVLGDLFRTVQGSARRVGADGKYNFTGVWPQSPIYELLVGVRELLARPSVALSDTDRSVIAAMVAAELQPIIADAVGAAVASAVEAGVESVLNRTKLAVV